MLLRRDVGALRPLRRWAGSRISVVPGAGARMGGSARRRRSRSHRRAGPWKRRVTSSCLTVVSSTVDLEEGWEQARKQTARLEGWDVHAMRGLVAPSQGGGGGKLAWMLVLCQRGQFRNCCVGLSVRGSLGPISRICSQSLTRCGVLLPLPGGECTAGDY